MVEKRREEKKKSAPPLGSSPDFNTDFTRLCFFTLAESIAGDKRTTLLFFLSFLRTFFCLFKVLTSEGNVTFATTFLGSLSEML